MPEALISEDAILRDYPRMGPDDPFTFRCGSSLDCFTHCCRDVSIVLTPYDVLCMKKALKIDSSTFLERYTVSPFTPDQKFPVVLLKMDRETRRCPFVGNQGCAIYAARPWACRMYPLGVAEPRNPNPDDRAFHFLLREELCQGHGTGRTFTVREWIADQGIERFDMNGESFKKLMLHDFWEGKQPLDPGKMEMYHMACYDLDRFRRFVFETRFLRMFEIDEARVAAMRADDEELLEFAMQWLRFCLFNEKTMKVGKSVVEARLQATAQAGAAAPSSAPL